jgi:hypothetical protein
MNHLFPPYVSQTCQRYMARWCVANRGIPFGSRATRSENIRDDYDKPVRLYFNFDDDHPETFDREEFERAFVELFPALYPKSLRPRWPVDVPDNFEEPRPDRPNRTGRIEPFGACVGNVEDASWVRCSCWPLN